MFKSKYLDGLSFRDLGTMNDALLTKQFWRLMENDSSLASKTLTARYFHNGGILQLQLGYHPSYA